MYIKRTDQHRSNRPITGWRIVGGLAGWTFILLLVSVFAAGMVWAINQETVPPRDYSDQISATVAPPVVFVTAVPNELTGMDALNQALKAGHCPDPEKIPVFIDLEDPENPGQLCPK